MLLAASRPCWRMLVRLPSVSAYALAVDKEPPVASGAHCAPRVAHPGTAGRGAPSVVMARPDSGRCGQAMRLLVQRWVGSLVEHAASTSFVPPPVPVPSAWTHRLAAMERIWYVTPVMVLNAHCCAVAPVHGDCTRTCQGPCHRSAVSGT